MKKLLSMALLLALVSPQAFATKARLIALGMDELDNEGSYYIDDIRNIFLNSAYVNDYADNLIFEWGDAGLFPDNNTAPNNNTYASYDTDENPKAQGGFLKSHGDMVYGVYLGNESNTSSLLKILSSAPVIAGFPAGEKFLNTSDNQIDVFFGKSISGVDWGLNLVYTSSEFESENSEDSGYAVRLGAKKDVWNAFLNASVGGESEKTVLAANNASSEDVTQKFEGSVGIHLGGGYDVSDEGRVYAYYKMFGWDQFDSFGDLGLGGLAGRGQEGTVEGSFDTYAVGYGHTVEHDHGTLFTDIHLRKRDIEVKFDNAAKVDELVVPVTVGYEAMATSWLTLRGSVMHNLYGVTKNDNYSSLNPIIAGLAGNIFGADTDGKKSTIRNSTTVNSGASLTFGDLTVDGLIGTTTDGSLNFDEVMTRVGTTYSF